MAKLPNKTPNAISAKYVDPENVFGKKTKTVYILRRRRGWVVQRGGDSGYYFYATQRAAIEGARREVRDIGSGQIVVYGLDGRVRDRNTYQLPAIQDPPGKKSVRIARAVSKVTRGRLAAEPLPPRG